jgi:hypothetical protein
MTKLTNAAPLRSVRWKGLQQGFIYSWAVSTYRTPRDVLSHFLDNALHFLDNAFFGRPPVALVDSRYIA